MHKDTVSKFHLCKDKYGQPGCSDNQFLQTLIDNFVNNQKYQYGAYFYFIFFSQKPLSKAICPECQYTTDSLSNLFEHFDSNHAIESAFSCTCGQSFCRLPDFLRHYMTCPVAATDLQDPSLSKSPNSTTPLKPLLIKNSISPETPQQDAEKAPDSDEISESQLSYYNFYKHPPVVPIKGPTDDKPFGCPKCPKAFKSKSLLEQHMHLHYPPRYKCRWCPKVYRWPPVYYHHLRTCKKMPVWEGSSEAPEESGNASTPPEVEHEYAALDLSQSTTSHAKPEPLVTPILPLPPTEFPCPCGATLPDVQSYFRHAAKCLNFIQPPPHPLPAPPTPLSPAPPKEEEEKSPLSPVLPPTKPRTKRFICSICAKDFTSKLSLKQHVDGKHRAEGKYVCKLCGKRYRWGASFYYHRRTCNLSNGVGLPSTGVYPRVPHISQPSA